MAVERIARILVPVDFSPHSDRALRYASSLARRLEASVQLLHVVEDPLVTGAWNAEVYVPDMTELLDNLVAGARRRIADMKTDVAKEGIEVESVVLTGRPSNVIVEHAKSGEFDLIVMGTHGRTGLAHAFMGSVAERVVRRAPCPVLTMRGREITIDTKPSIAAETVA